MITFVINIFVVAIRLVRVQGNKCKVKEGQVGAVGGIKED